LQLRTFLYKGCITIPAASKAVLQFSKVSVKQHQSSLVAQGRTANNSTIGVFYKTSGWGV
jgi:hypothetical protein